MENRNRNIWIVVAIVAVLACLCCAAVALALGGLGWLGSRATDWGPDGWNQGWDLNRVSDTSELTFEVGSAPVLRVENMAGNIDVRRGEEGLIQVVVTRYATNQARLEQIDVEPSQQGDTVTIVTRSPSDRLMANMSVSLEIVVPPGTRLDLGSGAGDVTIAGIGSEIETHTGAGNIDVDDALGGVELSTGAGDITYQGQPVGNCTFDAGAGNIRLLLPSDLAASISLDTGIGSVDVGRFDVDGTVTTGRAEGTIGGGGDASIQAHTGAGDIDLEQR